MTVTQSTWTSEEGKVFTVYYNVGENDVYLRTASAPEGEWATGTQTEQGWTLPTGKVVTIPALISEGQQPQGPVGSIVVGTAHTVGFQGHEHTFWPVEYISGYNQYGALWGNGIPNTEGGTALYVGPDGQLLPAHGS